MLGRLWVSIPVISPHEHVFLVVFHEMEVCFFD